MKMRSKKRRNQSQRTSSFRSFNTHSDKGCEGIAMGAPSHLKQPPKNRRTAPEKKQAPETVQHVPTGLGAADGAYRNICANMDNDGEVWRSLLHSKV